MKREKLKQIKKYVKGKVTLLTVYARFHKIKLNMLEERKNDKKCIAVAK